MAKKVTSTPPQKPAKTRAIDASELFEHGTEVAIEYRGEIYRLRITRNDKLILTK